MSGRSSATASRQEEEDAESDAIYVELAQELIKNRIIIRVQQDDVGGGAAGNNPPQVLSPTSADSLKQGHAH